MTEQATQARENESDEAVTPEAVDSLMQHPQDALQQGASDDESPEHNPLAGAEPVADVAPEEAAMHAESGKENALDASDIAQMVDPGNGSAPATVTRNRGMRWYIIHAYTGFEKKVAAAILEEAEQRGLREKFEEVMVPSEEFVEMRRGKKVQSERNLFPGYVLAKMEMTDATWQLVRSTDKVAGFLGGRGQRPQPISEAEASAILTQVQEGVDAPKRTFSFEIGEQVKVVDGPFDSFIGVVEDLDDDKEKLKVSVSIFGRPTPVELDYGQVEKV